jgi:hypothetical protein
MTDEDLVKCALAILRGTAGDRVKEGNSQLSKAVEVAGAESYLVFETWLKYQQARLKGTVWNSLGDAILEQTKKVYDDAAREAQSEGASAQEARRRAMQAVQRFLGFLRRAYVAQGGSSTGGEAE